MLPATYLQRVGNPPPEPRLITSPFTDHDFKKLHRRLYKVLDNAYPVSHGTRQVPAVELGRLRRKITIALEALAGWQSRMK